MRMDCQTTIPIFGAKLRMLMKQFEQTRKHCALITFRRQVNTKPIFKSLAEQEQ